jgi:surface protein
MKKVKNKQELQDLIKAGEDVTELDVSSITDMNGLFFCNTSFNQDISNWDVSNVTDMSCMFSGSVFNGDISNWDVSNVTDMRWMFSGSVFNGDISNWDVSNVTNMRWMFHSSLFNGDISNWDVSNVTDMRWMFSYAKSFNQNLSTWEISTTTDIHDMFNGAYTYAYGEPKVKTTPEIILETTRLKESEMKAKEVVKTVKENKVKVLLGFLAAIIVAEQILNKGNVRKSIVSKVKSIVTGKDE